MGLAAAVRSVGRWASGPRPWPEPDDLPWRSVSFAVVDVETTGLDLRRDEVISIGVVPVVGGRIAAGRWYQVVRPDRAITPASMKVHTLTPDEVATAPRLDEMLDALHGVLYGRVVVAHAAWVERGFLDRALRVRGERLPDGLVDTAALARAVGLRAPGSREPDLEELAAELGLPVHTPHHALGDAMTTAEVLLVLATRLEDAVDGDLTVRDLVRLTKRHPLAG
ncbi:MAG: 3'-5' exonuclease [Nocardioides sp.]|uniref:3'-5' exonuclease n=1 Tax=Nocardioides sp. TaxID=35761 RepID=UPI0039E5AB88